MAGTGPATETGHRTPAAKPGRLLYPGSLRSSSSPRLASCSLRAVPGLYSTPSTGNSSQDSLPVPSCSCLIHSYTSAAHCRRSLVNYCGAQSFSPNPKHCLPPHATLLPSAFPSLEHIPALRPLLESPQVMRGCLEPDSNPNNVITEAPTLGSKGSPR